MMDLTFCSLNTRSYNFIFEFFKEAVSRTKFSDYELINFHTSLFQKFHASASGKEK